MERKIKLMNRSDNKNLLIVSIIFLNWDSFKKQSPISFRNILYSHLFKNLGIPFDSLGSHISTIKISFLAILSKKFKILYITFYY